MRQGEGRGRSDQGVLHLRALGLGIRNISGFMIYIHLVNLRLFAEI